MLTSNNKDVSQIYSNQQYNKITMNSYFISTLRIFFIIIIALTSLLACEDESLIQNDTETLNSRPSVTGKQVKAANQSIQKAEGRYMVLFKDQAERSISQQAANEAR